MLRYACFALFVVVAGCSSEESGGTPSTPTDSATDTAKVTDTAVADTAVADTAVVDTAVVDSATVDSNTAVDSTVADTAAILDEGVTWDTAGACHGFGFGAPAVTIAKVSSLPMMTGGTIGSGIYDAVGFQTTGTLTGSYRATWSFVTGMKIEAIEQTTLSSPGPIVPRILTWSTSGTSLTRTQICGGTSMFTNEYTVRTESGATYLDVRQDTLMFTFKKR